jgi:hypothetical protein
MIELVVTTLSIVGWMVSIYFHPRLSESCIQEQTPNGTNGIEEAEIDTMDDSVRVDPSAVVIMESWRRDYHGRDRKNSGDSEGCAASEVDDPMLPVARIIVTNEGGASGGGVRARGFGLLAPEQVAVQSIENEEEQQG